VAQGALDAAHPCVTGRLDPGLRGGRPPNAYARVGVEARPLAFDRCRLRRTDVEDVDVVAETRERECEKRRRGARAADAVVAAELGRDDRDPPAAQRRLLSTRRAKRRTRLSAGADGRCLSAARPAARRARWRWLSGSTRSNSSTTARPSLGSLSTVPGRAPHVTSGRGTETMRAPPTLRR